MDGEPSRRPSGNCREPSLLSSFGFPLRYNFLLLTPSPDKTPFKPNGLVSPFTEKIQNGRVEHTSSRKETGPGAMELQQQPWFQAVRAMETASWYMERFHRRPRNAGDEEVGRSSGPLRAKWIGTWGAIIFT